MLDAAPKFDQTSMPGDLLVNFSSPNWLVAALHNGLPSLDHAHADRLSSNQGLSAC
jgi:hypothetical protein